MKIIFSLLQKNIITSFIPIVNISEAYGYFRYFHGTFGDNEIIIPLYLWTFPILQAIVYMYSQIEYFTYPLKIWTWSASTPRMIIGTWNGLATLGKSQAHARGENMLRGKNFRSSGITNALLCYFLPVNCLAIYKAFP